MERLTQEKEARTYRIYKMQWYANLALFIFCLFLSASLFWRMWQGGYEANGYGVPTTIMMSFLVLACLLLMGAGISRYQARLEGQHLEIKLAIRQVSKELDSVRAELARLRPETAERPTQQSD